MDFNIHCENVSHICPGREYSDINLWAGRLALPVACAKSIMCKNLAY